MTTNIVQANPAVVVSQGQLVAPDGQIIASDHKPDVILPPKPTSIASPMPTSMMEAANIPEYMRGAALGTADMREYVRPPFISIVQAMSPKEIKGLYGESACYVAGSNALILKSWQAATAAGESLPTVRFVPIFYYREFIEWNPRAHKDMIRSRTTDVNSALAAKCKSFEKGVRSYQCPEMPVDPAGKNLIKCQEHLNFVVMLLDHEINVPMLLSFSAGKHKDGRNFIKLINMRQAPMYGLIFDLSIGQRTNDDGQEYYSFDIQSAITADGRTAFVDEEWFQYLKGQHEQLQDDFDNQSLQAVYEETNAAEAALVAAADAKMF